jgi:hypothetical protein
MAAPVLHTRDFQRTTLRPRHRVLMPALVEAFFTYDAPLSSERLTTFSDDVDRAISNASKTLRFGLVVMLDVILLCPLLLIGKLATFDTLSLEDRVRVLDRIEHAKVIPLALVFVAWKTLLTMAFFEGEEEQKAMGYPGPERHRYLTVARG